MKNYYFKIINKSIFKLQIVKIIWINKKLKAYNKMEIKSKNKSKMKQQNQIPIFYMIKSGIFQWISMMYNNIINFVQIKIFRIIFKILNKQIKI